jgi:DNA-binding XRE family transcriptional regulator
MATSYNKAAAGRRANLSQAGTAQLREKHGLTQIQLAERSGIDQGDISRIERGSAMPNEKTLIRIADALSADLMLVPRSEK